ncbi:hypothetical protein SLEP1_g25976 [Rubroshorea leprosula]|uniref:Integrase catalytic domain-containing protein n=1 Tax=Rubroshorea leprosula TaxID=152421 RepID=A0AAV5JKC0_9ROSI|nr:hypothetical protein SLEP1_g25976 [Rubroshorea leprosula]
MSANNSSFVAWEEDIICPDRGSRVVHFYLKDATGNLVLAVIGTERSIRHMMHVVTGEFSQTYGSQVMKWRARGEVVEWLQSFISRPSLGQSSLLYHSARPELSVLPQYHSCTVITMRTLALDHQSSPNPPATRDLLRQNMPRSFNAVALLRQVTSTKDACPGFTGQFCEKTTTKEVLKVSCIYIGAVCGKLSKKPSPKTKMVHTCMTQHGSTPQVKEEASVQMLIPYLKTCRLWLPNISRFNDDMLEISSFDEAVGIVAMIQGLNHDWLQDNLIKHTPTTFDEVNERSLKFIKAEEYVLSKPPPPKEAKTSMWKEERRNELQTVEAVPTDLYWVVTPHNDPLVTSVILNNCEVQRVLVDTGSAPDIMYYHCFESLELDPALLQKYDEPIYRFNNQLVPMEGVLRFNIHPDQDPSYHIQSHLYMKFPTLMRIETLKGNQEVARHCYLTSVTKSRRDKEIAQPPKPTQPEVPSAQQIMGVELPDNRPGDEPRATLVEEVEEVHIDNNDPSKKTQIGTRLTPKEKEELMSFLKANKDVFAWISADMPGIPTSVAVHKLSTSPLKKPIAQKRRLFGGERLKAIREEVQNLLQDGFVRRVDYCEWITNLVLVKKSNGNIDKLVEATSGNERMSLLDAYSGYHQVHMAQEDEVKISFYAGDEIYCYIGRDLEVSIDDIVVKSLKEENHLADLAETFDNLKKYSMRLNPAKCVFGVESDKFLGFMVSRKGIEVNPKKIKAIREMKLPKSIKDIQHLIGEVAALHRFISKCTDKCLSFFRVLRSVAYLQSVEVLRVENGQADFLSRLCNGNSRGARSVYIEILNELSFQKNKVMEINTNLETPSSTDPIKTYLRDGTVPSDKQEEIRLQRKASQYTLIDDVLYRRSYSLPLLRCLMSYEAEYALREQDAKLFVQKYQKCQFFAHLTHQPTEELTNMVAPWPFAQWGIDLLCPFVKSVGGVTHLVIVVNYFTKWVEARPLSSLTSKKIEDFVFSSVIYRYGIPNQIIADNGLQFNCTSLRDFYSSYGIKLVFTSVYHPKANGMVESVNKAILEGIKPRLD